MCNCFQFKDKHIWRTNKESGSTTALVTQDFTQSELNGSFVQDLIICKYSYNKNSSDKLDREYRHFIGKVGDKNGINFVVLVGGSKLVQ